MEYIKEVNGSITQNRRDGGNSFWWIYGYIEKDERGELYYTEYAKENPRSIKINECPKEVKEYLLSALN